MRRGEYELLAERGQRPNLDDSALSLLGAVEVYVIQDFMTPDGTVYVVHYSNGDIEFHKIDGELLSFRPQKFVPSCGIFGS